MKTEKIKAIAKLCYKAQKLMFKGLYFYLSNKKILDEEEPNSTLMLLKEQESNILEFSKLFDEILKELVVLEVIDPIDYEENSIMETYREHIEKLEYKLKAA